MNESEEVKTFPLYLHLLQWQSEEANWSGSALFAIKYVNLYQQSESSNFDWLKIGNGSGILIYSAWQGLVWF